MGRLELLEREINKGIVVDEKMGQMIENWSPNNVRRLIIGAEFAAVHYFMTGGKYRRSIEIVDFRNVLGDDLNNFQGNLTSLHTVLYALVRGRICSSVEEIIFATKGYPQQLLSVDTHFNILTSGNATLENRFVRLRHVSLVDSDVRTLVDIANDSRECEVLLLDKLKDNGIQSKQLVEQHEEDWWNNTSLRPKYYKMDATQLQGYFNRCREVMRVINRQDRLVSLSNKVNLDSFEKHMPRIQSTIDSISMILTKADDLFMNTSVLNKAEWASTLKKSNMHTILKRELLRRKGCMQHLRTINFKGLTEVFAHSNQESDDWIQIIRYLKEELLLDILGDDIPSRFDNETSVPDSIVRLSYVVTVLHSVLTYIVYSVLVKYLTRNTQKYTSFFFSKLSNMNSLRYTKSIVEFCNNELTDGLAKQAFDAIGAVDITVEEMNTHVRSQEMLRILSALQEV